MPAATTTDRIAEEWAHTTARLNPAISVRLGDVRSVGFADHSPDGAERLVEAAARMRSELAAVDPSDDDPVTRCELEREATQLIDEHEAGMLIGDLNVIASPAQEIRNCFDLLPRDTDEDWARVRDALHCVSTALAGYRTGLTHRLQTGPDIPLRQVEAVAMQAHQTSAHFFARIADDPGAPPAMHASVRRGAEDAAAAYAELARFLTQEVAAHASDADGAGEHRYALGSRRFLGSSVDIDESYAWGWELLADITRKQTELAREICGEPSIPAAVVTLDEDPSRRVEGTDALQRWLQDTSDSAVTALSSAHFDITEEQRRLSCRIATAHDGGIYYTEPTLDGRRPGTMWWSVPPGVSSFRTWREKTTVFHEGVPGHHLQMGGAMLNPRLNVWRRALAGTSGHREGWALYAERLMQDLGFLDDPGERFGMLDAQRMRAARVVVDIGVHTGRRMPEDGRTWGADDALEFMRRNTVMSEPSLRYEVLRYLGWPGQAASYSIGQRIWTETRDDALSAGSDLKSFHARALALGGLGLSTFRQAMRGDV